MRRINPRSLASAKSIVLLLSVAIATLSTIAIAATIEVSPYKVTANGNDHYDRNPSFTVFDSESWLFYTKGDDDVTLGVRNSTYNPDGDSYTIWYKRAANPDDVTTTSETRLDLSATARPVGFDQRDVSAVVFQGNLYVFASAGFGGSQQPIYYYKWDGTTWTGPTALLTGGGGHANAVAAADRVYFTLEKGVPDTMRSVAYTWDGTAFNGPYVIANNNGVPKLTLKDGILYAVSIAPSANAINLHTSPASATPSIWTYVSDPITVSDAGVYVWDPSIFHDGSTLYALAAPSAAWPDMQWIVQARSTDNGTSWTPAKRVSAGGPGGGSTYWWDFWPIGWSDHAGRILIFFATEGSNGVYGDGAIDAVGVDWNLDNDHSFYIQQAVDASLTGDTVLVASGTYSGNANRDIDFGGKNIVLKSASGPDMTLIDCQGTESVPHRFLFLHSGEDSTTTVEGLTIRGGYDSTTGGAVYCDSSSVRLINCRLLSNMSGFPVPESQSRGGGVYCRGGTIRIQDCVFDSNFARGGGGLWCANSTAMIQGCSFSNNALLFLGGGGAVGTVASTIYIDSCVFAGNHGLDGAAVYCQGDSITLKKSVFVRNQGHLMCFDDNALARLESCTIANNIGSQGNVSLIEWWGQVRLTFDRTIIAFNRGAGAILCSEGASVPSLICSNIYGNEGANWDGCIAGQANQYGNLSSNPLFCDTTQSDFRIFAGSACSATHNSCEVLIGAQEVACFLCGDANGSGTVNISDAVYLIAYIFAGGPAPSPLLAGDTNCSNTVNISDAVYLIAYIFSGGPAPCAACP